jgi:hypothetical protein
MLLRLLLAVLMLMGPIPVRVCTCAASAMPPTAAEEPVSQSVPESKSCGCGHRAKQSETPATTSDTTHAHGDAKSDATTERSHSSQHDRDCPAVKPRVAISDAVVTPATDAPADAGFNLSVAVEPSVGGQERRFPVKVQPITSSVPLFITFLTLRN